MEFFNKAKAVRLKSHLDKYLVAGDDEETVRQSSNCSSRKARWMVELVDGKSHAIHLKSCHGKYLMASDEPFLLGMTGKKVVQTFPAKKMDNSVEWEPIKDGYFVKLRTKEGGKFMRANGGTPPWRNTVTHDVPHRTATQDWVLWSVDVIDIAILESYESLPSQMSTATSFSSLPSHMSPAMSFSSSPSHMSQAKSHMSPTTRFSSFSSAVSDDDDVAGSKNRSMSVISRSQLASSRQSGMEFFDRAKSVRLQSHLGKYLVADDDEHTVRQSRNGSSTKARWTVEFVEGKNHVIRLRSCHGLYLTASDDAFLLGMTGKKVFQTTPKAKMDTSIEWEPIKEGINVKLRTRDEKFLRANGGTPPWRNSVTHDIPHRTATQEWVLWKVDVVDISISDSEPLSRNISSMSSFSSSTDDFSGSPDTGSPMVVAHRKSVHASERESPGMELFRKAKTVRLRSHHDKYLIAEEDQESVCQDRNGSTRRAKWTVEFVETVENVVRFKSCFGKYLTATEEQFLLGVTGRKVLQAVPRKLDSSVEWEPVRDGFQIRLKTRYGNFLRANGGLPPWRNSVTHDIPRRHNDWILWEVDVVEIRTETPQEEKTMSRAVSLDSEPSNDSELISSPSFHLISGRFSQIKSSDSFGGSGSPMKSDGRIIYYNVAADDGKVEDAIEGPSFNFKGHGLVELTQKLEEETGLEDIIVCSRNRLNGKLYPLRLHLPPNNATMHVVIVPTSSEAARDLWPETHT